MSKFEDVTNEVTDTVEKADSLFSPVLSTVGKLWGYITGSTQANEIAQATLDQEQEQFETETWLNSVAGQAEQSRAAGVNTDFADITSLGAGATPDYATPASISADAAKDQSLASMVQHGSEFLNFLKENVSYKNEQVSLDTARMNNRSASVTANSQLLDYVDDTVIRGATPDLFDGGALNSDNISTDWLSDSTLLDSSLVSAERYNEDYWYSIGFSEEDSKRMARMARSTFSRRDNRSKVYALAKELYDSRQGFDNARFSPLSREDNEDPTETQINFYQSCFASVEKSVQKDLATFNDVLDTIAAKREYGLYKLEGRNTAKTLSASLQNLTYLIESGVQLSEIDARLVQSQLQQQLTKWEQQCNTSIQEMCSKWINSDSWMKKQWGFYNMNACLQGKYVPLDIANQGLEAVGNVFDVFSNFPALKFLSLFTK